MEKKDSSGAEGTERIERGIGDGKEGQSWSRGNREDRTRHRRWKRRTAMEQRKQEKTERSIGDGKEGQQWSRGNRRGQNGA